VSDERASSAESVEHPCNAALLDIMMWSLKPLRAKVVPQASGRVVEIGVGTGMNFSYYGGVESVHGIEPDPHMLRRARRRAERLRFPIELAQAGAEALPYDDQSFDTAVVTWVLCTIPDPLAALREVARVLRPQGRMLFVEHVRSRFPMASKLQDAATPLWKKLAGGCCLNRDSIALIRSIGFKDVEVRPCGREGWTLLPIYRGSALRA
jgi:ubiquinone/menaquinone biosynthesis C-methylase UbiE